MSRAPGHPIASYVLCTDPASRLLIVQAAGIGTWHLPGGVVEVGNPRSTPFAVRPGKNSD